MQFDTLTLMMAGSITTALSGVLLLGVWAQLRQTALLWWFAADIIYAVGIALLTIGMSGNDAPLIVTGGLLSDLAVPLIWIGVRTFNDQRPAGVSMLLVVITWLAIDLAASMMPIGPLVSFLGWAVWLSAAAVALWRGRSDHIPARWPLMAVLLIHAFVFVGGMFDILIGRIPHDGIAPINSWFGTIFFEGIVYAMASAILMALLCKERETQAYKRAARTDSLTGTANHGALLESAQRTYERSRVDGTPYSLIMFDLDHFKTINDLYGHRAGDNILRAFADIVRGLLRPTDIFGRYGGEEFTVILPGATVETAAVIAERVRHAFAEQHRFLDGQTLNATVSAGVAEAGMSLEDTIDAADRAMYRAKSLGRNRVERIDRQPPANGHDTIIRIA